ncbi:MAG: gamma-glutamyl-gamma-aminobutyrate hydrolase family protein [Gaiellales bacterium]
MRPPVIGLTAFRRDLPTYLGAQTDLYTLDPNYTNGITRAGGLPLIIPHNEDPAAVLELLDGLVMTGGGDLHPEHYGAETATELEDSNAGADVWELALARGARERGLPVLGICRGIQALAVAAGGTMIQDLRPEHGHPMIESTPEALIGSRHEVEVSEGSQIASVMGRRSFVVNSIHHQAVVDPGDLIATARVGQVVEALESASAWEAIGVQWHPEKMHEPEQQALFGFVVDAARRRRDG